MKRKTYKPEKVLKDSVKNLKFHIKDFVPLVEKLLFWEMQKIGDGMYYEIHLPRQGRLGMIYLEMDVEPIVYDPSS
jgi:hypothetical protein